MTLSKEDVLKKLDAVFATKLLMGEELPKHVYIGWDAKSVLVDGNFSRFYQHRGVLLYGRQRLSPDGVQFPGDDHEY
jgi:hypothetical protein